MTPRSPGPDPFPIREGELVSLLAMLQALQALAIDMMLPALGVMSRDLGVTDPNQRQLVVGIFLVGIGLGALIPGPLADRFGRRPVLFGCLAFYIVPAVACAFVQDFNTLLGLRLVQAVGCSGLAIVPQAIIRDRFEGDRMARLQSMISVIFMTVPMFAPSLGQAVMALLGWRWIFGIMAILASMVTVWIWFRLPETAHRRSQVSTRVNSLAITMIRIAFTRQSIGYVLASTLMMSAIWGFINSSQQLVAEHFGAGTSFPYIFGLMALGMAMASLVNSRIVERFGARRVSQTGLFAFIAIASLQVWLAFQPGQTLWQFVPLMAANMALLGFMGANFGSIALQPFAENAGAAASVQAFIRTIIASILGAVIGQAYDGSARPIAFALLAAGLLSLGLVLFSENGVLFRRVYPRGARRPDV